MIGLVNVALLFKNKYYNEEGMPKKYTEKYSNQIVETVEDFQIRRVDYVCEKLYAERGYLKEWEIIRTAGLRKGCSINVENKITDNIENYNKKNYSSIIFPKDTELTCFNIRSD